MSDLLKDHKNYRVFNYFQEICRIPHGSGNTLELRNYIVSIAKEHEFDHVVEVGGNVVVIREGSGDCINAQPVMLQSHLDMVCEKESDIEHDFEKDPLDLYIEDGFIKARGTTLGGDDGIGVAYMLSLLTDPDYSGPRLDCVFTTDEEIGMLGATTMDFSRIRARRLINLDCESEGVFITGCAGGERLSASLSIKHKSITGFQTDIVVSGLTGGHSGDEINKGRANAIRILSRFLFMAKKAGCDYHLITVNGGNKDNAIPREATASLVVTSSPVRLCDLAEEYNKIIFREYGDVDPGITVNVYEAGREASHKAMDNSILDPFFLLTYSMPDGVINMSRDIADLPETSVNLGILKTDKRSIEASYLLRSSLSHRRNELLERMTLILNAANAGVTCSNSYPAWEYKKDSPLRESLSGLWKEMYGKAPEISAIHGGLECGIISDKCPDMDIVAIGPDILDIHTPQERLDIESASRVYDFLVRFLRDCK